MKIPEKKIPEQKKNQVNDEQKLFGNHSHCLYPKYKIFFYRRQVEKDNIHTASFGWRSNFQGIENTGSIYGSLLTGYPFILEQKNSWTKKKSSKRSGKVG